MSQTPPSVATTGSAPDGVIQNDQRADAADPISIDSMNFWRGYGVQDTTRDQIYVIAVCMELARFSRIEHPCIGNRQNLKNTIGE